MTKLIDAELLVERIFDQLPTIEDEHGRGKLIFRASVCGIIDLLIRESKAEKKPIEAIESELQKLAETVGKELRRQDQVIHASNVGIGHSLREQDKRTIEIEKRQHRYYTFDGPELKRRIGALEESQKQIEALIDLESFREWLDSLKIKKSVPTDKDEPKFQTRDIIIHRGGDIEIVLKAKPNSVYLRDVLTGDEWWTSYLYLYTLVYRPGSPKPEPTVKEKIDTDRFGKPPGGLEPGDVLEYNSPCYAKRIEAIFIEQTSAQKAHGWIEAYRVCDGKVSIIDIEVDDCKFKFRPRFSDRKER